MRNRNLFVFILLTQLTTSSCKYEHQYPEDDKKTKKSPWERLKGRWQLSEYTENGISIVDSLNELYPANVSYGVTELHLSMDTIEIRMNGISSLKAH
jgi:hypothetical protein